MIKAGKGIDDEIENFRRNQVYYEGVAGFEMLPVSLSEHG
jgi:hypothetical protein